MWPLLVAPLMKHLLEREDTREVPNKMVTLALFNVHFVAFCLLVALSLLLLVVLSSTSLSLSLSLHPNGQFAWNDKSTHNLSVNTRPLAVSKIVFVCMSHPLEVRVHRLGVVPSR